MTSTPAERVHRAEPAPGDGARPRGLPEHELLERIFATTELQVALLDADFNFVRVNPAYARAAEGRDPAFFVGKNHFALYPDAENEALFRRVLATGEPHTESARPFEYPGHPERGVTYWDWTVQRVVDEHAGPSGVLLTLVDVTEQVRSFAALQASEQRLRERESYYRGLIESSMDGLVTVGGRLDITDVNRRMCDMVGVSRERLVGTRFADWFADPVSVEDLVGRTSAEGRLPDHPLILRAADGHEVPVTLSATLVAGLQGDARVIFASVHDMTFTRQLEQQLRQAQKMEAIGRLAGGVAHDFKNMLTIISLYAGLVANALPADDPRRGDAEEVVQAAGRAVTMLRQLLTLGRRQDTRPALVEPAEIVGEIAPMLRRLLGSTVELRIDGAAGTGPVMIDPAQLEEVLVNLVTNAREAMPAGGRLTIEMRDEDLDAAYARSHPGVEPGAYVRLAVGDTGAGMDPATLEHIFEPFYTTRPVGQGTGLGLSSVYGIVGQAGGHIDVRSAPGEGSTFTIFLPRADGIAGPPEA